MVKDLGLTFFVGGALKGLRTDLDLVSVACLWTCTRLVKEYFSPGGLKASSPTPLIERADERSLEKRQHGASLFERSPKARSTENQTYCPSE